MKLNEEERKILLNFGYIKEDFKQIENTKYIFILCEESNEKQITEKEAREKLSPADFLSGIARASFHFSAMRENIYISRKDF